MCLTGHNSSKGCRYCDIKGIYKNHIYYPTIPPENYKKNCKTYDSRNLPLRTHSQFKERLQVLSNSNSVKEKAQLQTEFGKLTCN
jgi:hypothetical protein